MYSEQCPCCGKGKVEDDKYREGWYKCVTCGADANNLIDGFFYPILRINHLCNLYTPVKGFNHLSYTVGTDILFKTSRGTLKSAKVIHVDRDERNPRMIIGEADTGRIRFVIERETIADAYSNLFPDNKAECVGWFNRGITIE